jgi:hypothetical protein
VRGLVSIALLVAALAPAALGGGARTDLRITVWPDGPKEPARRWTLGCAPVAGTLPRTARACAALGALRRPFLPVPPELACTEIYGGPAEALVTGSHRGRRVWAHFSRTDGCQIDRWQRHAFLFGGVKLADP